MWIWPWWHLGVVRDTWQDFNGWDEENLRTYPQNMYVGNRNLGYGKRLDFF
jgi:hypothetical protein